MALYVNGTKVLNSLIIDGNTGGRIAPTFTETVLVDNSSLASSFTFSSDYHNYDFLRFKIYNSSSGVYTNILTIPATVDAIFDVSAYILFNEFYTNQGCDYSENGLTWTRTWIRNCNIYEVVGLICNNATVTTTEIYKATTYTGTAVSITTQEDLFAFDWIMFASNDSGSDELLPSQTIYTNSTDSDIFSNLTKSYVLQDYNGAGQIIRINEHSMTAAKFLHVVGINFT